MNAFDFKANLETIIRAAEDGNLSVMEVQIKATKETRYALCAVNQINDGFHVEYEMVPLALMIEGNPYDLYNPPDPDGGFYEE